MTALPKRRISSGRRGRRRSAITLKMPNLTPCPHCGQPKAPHVVCPSCGQYKEQVVIAPKEKKTKKE